MDLKFERNPIGFDSAGCMRAIMKMAEAYMNQTADIMMEIMKKHIDRLGNGSKIMKADAKAAVREILREVTSEYINLEIGVDESYARAMSEQFYVRTMVVLHGNQAEGPIHTKPGRSTWKKHVDYRSINNYSKTVHPLPQFDWRLDFSELIVQDTIKDLEKYFRDMLNAIAGALDAEFFAGFITGG